MSDSGVYVENPLSLTGLFGEGLFLPPERKKRKFLYYGRGDLGILHVVKYPQNAVSNEAKNIIGKIMSAIKFKNTTIQPEDYAMINLSDRGEAEIEKDIIPDFVPAFLILWSDIPSTPGSLFYKAEEKNGVRVLQCHSVETMISDPERKSECWRAMKELFGM